MKCPNCERDTTHDTCPYCGTKVSEDSGTIDEDQMIEAASLPNLGAMLRRGKEKGYIPPQESGSGPPV